MKKTLAVICILAFSLFLSYAGLAQTLNYRAGVLTVARWIETLRGAPILNSGYYRQMYSGTAADAFKIDYTGSGNLLLNLLADGSPVFTLTKSGDFDIVGHGAIGNIASVSSSYTLTVQDEITATSGGFEAVYGSLFPDPTGDSSAWYTGALGEIWIDSISHNFSSFLYGSYGYVRSNGTGNFTNVVGGVKGRTSNNGTSGTMTTAYGVAAVVDNANAGTITNAYGTHSRVMNNSTGDIGDAFGVWTQITADSTGTIDNGYGIYVATPVTTGTLTANYGIYLEDQTGGGTNYSIYSAGGNSYHAGDIEIDGHLGLAESDPSSAIVFDMAETYADTSGFVYGLKNYVNIEPPSDTSVIAFANFTNIENKDAGSENYTGTYYGGYYQAQHEGSGTMSTLVGGYFNAWCDGDGDVTSSIGGRLISMNEAGTMTESIGAKGEIRQRTGAGTTVDGYAFKTRIDNTLGSITRAYGYYFTDGEAAADIGTLYGMYLETPTKGSTNYSIYSAGGDNYLGGNVVVNGTLRGATSQWYIDQHYPVINLSPGGSGPVQVIPSALTLGGYNLDDDTEYLYFTSHVHADWDGASDLIIEFEFEVDVDNSGGNVGDDAQFDLECFYSANGGIVKKTQTPAATVVIDQSPRYKQFEGEFIIDYDIGSGNDVAIGDIMSHRINFDETASDITDVVLIHITLKYQTKLMHEEI